LTVWLLRVICLSIGEQMLKKKLLLKSLSGEITSPPPAWLMRQAGRYLPEYRSTRAKAGDFLSLCYNPELAAEVTLQPIRRFGFDAAIIFADILLVPQALGVDLRFVEGEGPRLSTISSQNDLDNLKPVDEIDSRLSPVYDTVRLLKSKLPEDVALIGFAGAPWTVATYMIAGRGTSNQAPAHDLMKNNTFVFDLLIEKITRATIHYLRKQIEAGAEVIKLFDSWAGSLSGQELIDYSLKPLGKIVSALKDSYPHVPVIVFPRGAGKMYRGFAKKISADAIAIDQSVSISFMKDLQTESCVQGNLDPKLMVRGGKELIEETKKLREKMSEGPYIFNLGHGITPDADPKNVEIMLNAIRS